MGAGDSLGDKGLESRISGKFLGGKGGKSSSCQGGRSVSLEAKNVQSPGWTRGQCGTHGRLGSGMHEKAAPGRLVTCGPLNGLPVI